MTDSDSGVSLVSAKAAANLLSDAGSNDAGISGVSISSNKIGFSQRISLLIPSSLVFQ